MRIPAYVHEYVQKVNNELKSAKMDDRPQPTPEEMAAKLKISVQNVNFALSLQNYRASSLDMGSDDKTSIHHEKLPGPVSEPYEQVVKKEMRAALEGAIRTFNLKTQEILRLRFEMAADDNSPQLTLKEIGERVNLTSERVRQIQDEALVKLANPRKFPELAAFASL